MPTSQKNETESKNIATLLNQALLQDGKMAHALYEYELAENVDAWYESLKADRDEFVFAVTTNSGHVAMVLISKEKTIFINEEARAKLRALWETAYAPNMQRLIPLMSTQLADGILALNGVKIAPPEQEATLKRRGSRRR